MGESRSNVCADDECPEPHASAHLGISARADGGMGPKRAKSSLNGQEIKDKK